MGSRFFKDVCCLISFLITLYGHTAFAQQIPLTTAQVDAFFASTAWPDTQRLGEAILQDKASDNVMAKKVLRHIGIAAITAGHYSLSSQYFARLVKISTVRDEESRYFGQKMRGVNAYYQGNFKEAIRHYQAALETAKLRNIPLEIASIENNLGLVYSDVNQTSQSLSHYLAAHKLYQQHGSQQDKVDILLNLSSAYIRQSRYDSAASMLKQAASDYRLLNLPYGEALAYANLGVVMAEVGELDSARTNFEKAIEFYTRQNDAQNLAKHYGNLANLSVRVNEFERAGKELAQGQQFAQKAEHEAAWLAVLVPLAKWQLSQGMLTEANTSIQRIVELATKLDDPLKQADAEALKSLHAAASGQHEQAVIALEAFFAGHRALQSTALRNQLEEFEGNFAAQQLSQQLQELRQQQELQMLEDARNQQNMAMLGLLGVLLLTAIIAWYIHHIERKAKLRLALEVQQQTDVLHQVAADLRRSDNVKSQFLANMSHEIRTPLTAILGHVQMLQMNNELPREVAESLQVIQKQGGHLHELINDILDLSRIEAEQLHIQKTNFDLISLIDDLEAMFEVTAQNKKLSLHIECELDKPFAIRGDYVRLKQVLVNLLGNALKFTEQGWVKLLVKDTAGTLHFIVEDSGIGMSQKQLQVIFDSFKQGDDSITRRFGGSGLGLCLSKKLATMMGGDISVSSVHHVGSRFELILPLEKVSDNVELQESIKPFSVAKIPEQPLQGTVLLAEDHPENRALAVRLLEQFGLDVFAVENGEQAVEFALREFPDVLLLDIQMPKLDGFSAMKLLRQSGYIGPIFALTANVLSHEVEKYLAAGFTGHLPKPFNSKDMYHTLAQLLNAHANKHSDFSVDLSDLKASFINSFPQERANLICFFEEQRWYDMRALCHRLHGAALTFECKDIADTSAQLERVLSHGDTEHYQDYYLILCDELSQYQAKKAQYHY